MNKVASVTGFGREGAEAPAVWPRGLEAGAGVLDRTSIWLEEARPRLRECTGVRSGELVTDAG